MTASWLSHLLNQCVSICWLTQFFLKLSSVFKPSSTKRSQHRTLIFARNEKKHNRINSKKMNPPPNHLKKIKRQGSNWWWHLYPDSTLFLHLDCLSQVKCLPAGPAPAHKEVLANRSWIFQLPALGSHSRAAWSRGGVSGYSSRPPNFRPTFRDRAARCICLLGESCTPTPKSPSVAVVISQLLAC